MPSSIKHKYIMKKRLITTITILFLAIMSSVAQTKSFKGTVIDNKDGQPVIGASVIVTDAKGKTITGVSTDLDGLFSISIPEAGKEIKVSSVGYLDYIAPARSASGVKIYLEQDSQTLDAVVVTALGITREAKSLNYSRQSVDASSMNEIKASDFVASLSGKVAGVSVTPSGVSNGTSRVVIRGTSSLTENSMPVFVIDGMVIENQPGDSGVGVDGGSGSLDMGNPAADINPDDIKDISVLKDASATAIYGSRGSNGVIIVTTKGDTASKVSVSFSAGAGMSELPRKLDIMNATEFAQFRNDYRLSAGNVTVTTPQVSGSYPFENPASWGEGTDWQDVLTRKAFQQDYKLNVGYGDRRQSVWLSFGYEDRDGIVIGTGMRRYSTLVKFSRQLFKFMKIGARCRCR